MKTIKDEPRLALLRIYGSQGDTTEQLYVFDLMAGANLGPRLYSSFEQGRIEEYLPSSPLSWAELTNDSLSKVIAKKIAAIHKLNVQLDKSPNWLLDKFNYYNKYVELHKGTELSFRENISDFTKNIAYQMMVIDFRIEIDHLAKLIESSNPRLVFSHNDLHQNNILMLHDQNKDLDDRIVIIDFEYFSYNYRTFDLANHLSEWCFDYNGEEYPNFNASLDRFPSDERQRQFIGDYLSQFSENERQDLFGLGVSESEQIEMLFNEMQPFLMASNLLWSIWAIHGSLSSQIKFGYWEMAKYKWDIYKMCKRRYEQRLSKAQSDNQSARPTSKM